MRGASLDLPQSRQRPSLATANLLVRCKFECPVEVAFARSELRKEVGETFAYEIYVDRDDPIGDIHMVLIAAPDSPITHDGPDPKRADIKWTPEKDVLIADAGVVIVGIIADGDQQVREMCVG